MILPELMPRSRFLKRLIHHQISGLLSPRFFQQHRADVDVSQLITSLCFSLCRSSYLLKPPMSGAAGIYNFIVYNIRGLYYLSDAMLVPVDYK